MMVTSVVGTFYKWSFNGHDIMLNRIYTSVLIFTNRRKMLLIIIIVIRTITMIVIIVILIH